MRVKILLHDKHFMRILNVRDLKGIQASDFSFITEEKDNDKRLPSVYNEVLMNPEKSIVKHKECEFEKDYLWDMETHTDKINNHTPFNIGYGYYKDVEERKHVKVNYGYDCIDEFINKDVKRINDLVHNQYLNKLSKKGITEKEANILTRQFDMKNKYEIINHDFNKHAKNAIEFSKR